MTFTYGQQSAINPCVRRYSRFNFNKNQHEQLQGICQASQGKSAGTSVITAPVNCKYDRVYLSPYEMFAGDM